MEDTESQASNQFGVGTILILTAAVALLLGYAQSLGSSSTGGSAVVHLLVYIGLALIAAMLAAAWTRNLRESVYWPVLTSVLVYLAVAGGRLPSESIFYGWGVLAAACGALAAVRCPKSLVLGMLSGALAGGLSILAAILWFQESVKGLVLFDVLCGAVIGAILRPAIDWLRTLLERSGHSAVAMAAWMSLIVLLGNFLVPIIGGVQR